jgi:hypothetical protein
MNRGFACITMGTMLKGDVFQSGGVAVRADSVLIRRHSVAARTGCIHGLINGERKRRTMPDIRVKREVPQGWRRSHILLFLSGNER